MPNIKEIAKAIARANASLRDAYTLSISFSAEEWELYQHGDEIKAARKAIVAASDALLHVRDWAIDNS